MNISTNGFLQSISFKFYSTEEIKKLSVVEVTNPQTFDALGHCTKFGLYDNAMGTFYFYF